MQNLISSAAVAGTISPATSSLLSGNLGAVVIAGAAGKDAEDIVASDVTLVTLLVDASSSIHDRQLEDAIREGQNLLVDALGDTRERESIPTALWTFNHDLNVVHSYVGLDDVTRLDAKNYAGLGATRLYDRGAARSRPTWRMPSGSVARARLARAWSSSSPTARTAARSMRRGASERHAERHPSGVPDGQSVGDPGEPGADRTRPQRGVLHAVT